MINNNKLLNLFLQKNQNAPNRNLQLVEEKIVKVLKSQRNYISKKLKNWRIELKSKKKREKKKN